MKPERLIDDADFMLAEGSLYERLRRNPAAAARVTGLHANTSAKSPEDFGANMWALRQQPGVRLLGGCCGTSTEHIDALARQYAASA